MVPIPIENIKVGISIDDLCATVSEEKTQSIEEHEN